MRPIAALVFLAGVGEAYLRTEQPVAAIGLPEGFIPWDVADVLNQTDVGSTAFIPTIGDNDAVVGFEPVTRVTDDDGTDPCAKLYPSNPPFTFYGWYQVYQPHEHKVGVELDYVGDAAKKESKWSLKFPSDETLDCSFGLSTSGSGDNCAVVIANSRCQDLINGYGAHFYGNDAQSVLQLPNIDGQIQLNVPIVAKLQGRCLPQKILNAFQNHFE